jgi:hypothetical protein
VDWTNPLATPEGFKESNTSPVSKKTSPRATAEKLAILNSQLHQGFENLQSSQVESTNRLIEAIKSIPTQSPLLSNVNWTPILHGITNVIVTSLGGKPVEFTTPTSAVQAPGEAQGVANLSQVQELIDSRMTPLINRIDSLETSLKTLVASQTNLTNMVSSTSNTVSELTSTVNSFVQATNTRFETVNELLSSSKDPKGKMEDQMVLQVPLLLLPQQHLPVTPWLPYMHPT